MNTGGHLNKLLAVVVTITALMLFSASQASSADSFIRVTAVGDIMMGSTYPEPFLPPNDGAGIFDAVRSDLDGDIVFGNLEGPLIDNGKTGKCRKNSTMCYAFSTPTRYAKYLKDAGFNVLNLANNHAFDFGEDGLKNTVATLDASSIKSIFTNKVDRFNLKGKKVAVVGFSFSTPSPHSITDIDAAKQVVAGLKATSEIVIVSFHGGAEGKAGLRTPNSIEYFAGENRGNCIRFSRSMVDAGADLVLGHGPHVLRPVELYKNKLIVYSLGNFLTYGRFNIREENGISMILKADISIDSGDFAGGRLIPLKLIDRGLPTPDPVNAAIMLVKELGARDIGKGQLTITEEGLLVKGARSDGD